MSEVVFGCPFCGASTKPVSVERKRVLAKCGECNYIHIYNYSDTTMRWYFEHSETPKENQEPKKEKK